MSDIMEYKCPCCGGGIEFNSAIQKLKCPYCETEYEISTLQAYEEELSQDQADDMQLNADDAGEAWDETETENLNVYVCKSCGGEIIGDGNTAADICPYCGNPVVMTGHVSGVLKPDCVLPFQLDKEAAKAALSKHFEKKRLLPKSFKSQNHIDEIKGVYVPFWLFSADADARLRFRATKKRFWDDPQFTYTETSHYAVTRAGALSFVNVPADGSSQMADDLMESLEPYDFSKAVDFHTAYLAGYLADKYDVTAKECVERIHERIRQSTEREFRDTVEGYATVTTENSGIRIADGQVKYALLPVWLLQTTWNGEHYLFAMNGQTGKFVGNLPMDKGLYHKSFALIASLTALGVLALSFIGSML